MVCMLRALFTINSVFASVNEFHDSADTSSETGDNIMAPPVKPVLRRSNAGFPRDDDFSLADFNNKMVLDDTALPRAIFLDQGATTTEAEDSMDLFDPWDSSRDTSFDAYLQRTLASQLPPTMT